MLPFLLLVVLCNLHLKTNYHIAKYISLSLHQNLRNYGKDYNFFFILLAPRMLSTLLWLKPAFCMTVYIFLNMQSTACLIGFKSSFSDTILKSLLPHHSSKVVVSVEGYKYLFPHTKCATQCARPVSRMPVLTEIFSLELF